MAETFREWLEKQIEERWDTIQAFAAAVGVRDSAVSAWLHRGIFPKPGTEEQLAKVTGTPVADILAMMHEGRKQNWVERMARRDRRKKKSQGGEPTTPPNAWLIPSKPLAAARLYRSRQAVAVSASR